MKLPTSIGKKKLWQYVNVKIGRKIHHAHVFSIIMILFDEIIKDLADGKKIQIFNFGTLMLKETKPRMYHNVVHMQVMLSDSHKILKFSLSPKIRKKLCNLIDIDKTFRSN